VNKKEKILDIHSPQGTKVKCSHWTWGYKDDQEIAKKYLEKDKIYTVDRIEVFSSYSNLYLEEFYGIIFNAIMFEQV